MADRYCPFCGVLVPSNSITCPKCYKKIPPEPAVKETRRESGGWSSGSGQEGKKSTSNIGLLLAVIPGLFGFLGLGQIYRNHSSSTGYMFLLIGLLVFATIMVLVLTGGGIIVGTLKVLVIIPLSILYAVMYIICALVELTRGAIVFNRHRSVEPEFH